ncbi:NlpC/P60 family protein [Psychromonas sp.]|nr:NlpC/P60 family protein [Psychromonas sp.]MDA7746667.1 NlpC/P60 family protein [Psychromonas sp.]
MKKLFKFALLPLIYLLAACSSPSTRSVDEYTGQKVSEYSESDRLLYITLQGEYNYWAGSPFRLGGATLKGVDCSSLVQKVYQNSIKINLPRTTELQAEKGIFVKRSQLKVGDLVFFKTGWKVRHVGIYMGENKFFHASTSKGVITSDLNNPYWNKHYWQSRRVIK